MAKVIGAFGFLLIAVLSGCDFMSHTHCDDKILAQEKSPDGKYTAILYHRSCANDTGLYTCVNIKAAGALLSKGETYPVLTIKGFHEISAVWINPSSLEITSQGLEDKKTVLTQEIGWKDVKISYKNQ